MKLSIFLDCFWVDRINQQGDKSSCRTIASWLTCAAPHRAERATPAAEANLLAPLEQEARESIRGQVRLLATRLDALDPLESPCELAEEVDAELPTPRRPARSTRSL
jgi:hypothetical protein